MWLGTRKPGGEVNEPFSVSMIHKYVTNPLNAAGAETLKEGGLWTKVGLVPVMLLRGFVELPICALAATIEAVVMAVLNLVGALFNEQCRKDLGSCLLGVVVYPLGLVASPFMGVYAAIMVMLYEKPAPRPAPV